MTSPILMQSVPSCSHDPSTLKHFVDTTWTPAGTSMAWCVECGSLRITDEDGKVTWHAPAVPMAPPGPQKDGGGAQANGAAPLLSAEVMALVEANKGIFLDIGCSDHKSAGSVGMDKRAVAGVDIVHDIEVTPWPLPEACCARILASHIIEHLNPSCIVTILNEMHRVMRPGGQLLIAMPYAGSPRFWQDPTHRHAWNEATCQYFSCDFPLWHVYRPQCWKIDENWWDSVGDLHVIMSKRTDEHGQYHTQG